MSSVRALILTGFGLNCDNESAYACTLAGASVQRVHINRLIDGQVSLDDFEIMVFGGGFSWGDDHGAGVIQAVRLKTNLGGPILRFVNAGKLVLGICNGFQALVNLGLLPGFNGDYTSRTVAIIANDCGNFRNDWVTLKINSDTPCIFTKGMDCIELPVRHGEGKFYSDRPVIERLIVEKQVVLRYARSDGMPAKGQFPLNPNGSVDDIAGICDPTGRIFGLMPHPEAFNHFTNHPDWTRMQETARRRGTAFDVHRVAGLDIFKNAVEFAQKHLTG
jgi:phosphoribosylformylglycinamidine synthase I